MAIQVYSAPGSYTFTLPISTGITIRIAGAGGGTGGTDGGPPAIVGGSGGKGRYGVFTLPDYTYGTFTFVVGGAGGNGGNSGTVAFNGGAGGFSATSAGGGGQEDSPSGSSGGGAGGGGASSISSDGLLLAIAGGGGGGGGGTKGAYSNIGGVRTNGQDASTFSASTTSPTSTPDATGSVTGTGGDGGGAGGGGGGYTAGARGTFPGNDNVHPSEGGFGGGSFYRSDRLTLSSQSTYTSSLNGYIEIEYTKVTFNDPAISISKAGPYYSSGEIKFSDLRRDFRAQQRRISPNDNEIFLTDNDPIKASRLLRNTSTRLENPIVPDCTENRISGPLGNGISDSKDWKVSQFRNSIKYYYVTLPSSDEIVNFNVISQNWNSNIDKNIHKFMFIQGTCGSFDASLPAVAASDTAHNLTLDVYGTILGAAGRGGGTGSGADDISGQNGGNAIEIGTANSNNMTVWVRSSAKIYGGGGGGERGKTGANGKGATCYEYYYIDQCSQGAPSCAGGWNQIHAGYGCCEWKRGCNVGHWTRTCERRYDVSGGVGGVGGVGGIGRGYNYQSGSLEGGDGNAGTSGGGCGATDGGDGGPGGSGGNWGVNGQNTVNTGTGGIGGKAISGYRYTVIGSINNSNVIKGLYY